MKKARKIIFIMSFLVMLILTHSSKAASLDTIEINTNKEIVNPGTEVELIINFGKELGSYTFDIAYDNNLLEFVSTDGGTQNDMGTKVRIVYYDSSGGTNPRESMKVVFKAKEGIQTSNPTDFSITAEGLANPDASEQYDDIDVPIKKNITVEPAYEDYKFELTYSGNPIINEEKDMKLVLSSNMGRFYDHTRILVQATTPSNANVQLLAIDEQSLEHDLIDNGWGDASGDKIGGVVNKVINMRGIFDMAGEYKLTFNLIDRDQSDKVLATNTFVVNVTDNSQIDQTPQNPEVPGTQEPTEEETPNQEPVDENNVQTQEEPTELPRTGYNYYILFGIIILAISFAIYCIKLNKKSH